MAIALQSAVGRHRARGVIVNGWTWQRVTRHWMSLFGIVTPPLGATVNTIVAAHQPCYDFLHNYVSDLAATGRPYSGILCAWWATFPLQFGPFAIAVALGLRGKRFGQVVPALLGLFAVFIGLCGIFRFDPGDPTQTAGSRAHVVVSSMASAMLFPCPFLLWLITRHDDGWRRCAWFSLVMQAAGISAGIALGLTWLHVVTLCGLAERAYWIVYYIWIVGLALKLREMDSPE